MTPALLLSILALFLPSIALVALAIAFFRLDKQVSTWQQGADWTKGGAQQRAEDLLEKARIRSERLIQEGEEKAEEIVSDTKLFSQHTQEEMSQAIERMVKEQTAAYQQVLSTTKRDLVDELHQLSETMRKESQKAVTDLHLELREQANMSLKALTTQLNNQQQEHTQVLSKFQVQLEQELNQRGATILTESIQEVTHRALSSRDQQQIVLEVLASAKDRNLFSALENSSEKHKDAQGS